MDFDGHSFDKRTTVRRSLANDEDMFFTSPVRRTSDPRKASLWSTASVTSRMSRARLRMSAMGALIQGALVDLKMVDVPRYPPAGYQRYLLALLGCWAITCVYALRVNMSVAVLAMKNETVDVNGTEEPVRTLVKIERECVSLIPARVEIESKIARWLYLPF